MSEFFFIIAPGLEKLAQKELELKWLQLSTLLPQYFTKELPSIHIEKGGISIKCKESSAWILNHYLKIPTRILQRLDRFRVRDIPKLFEKIRRMNWHNFLREGSVEIEVSTHSSRLKIKDRISQACQDALKDAQKHQPFRKKFLDIPQAIFIRIVDDDVTVSLDTSGDPLYKRGYKSYSVEAPIRENLAAALWFATEQGLQNSSVSASTIANSQELDVLDPMCGSGTLLLEAAFFWRAIRSRKFSYQNFPIVSEQAPSQKWPDLATSIKIKNLIGFDLEKKSIEASQNNFNEIKKNNLDINLISERRDSLGNQILNFDSSNAKVVLVNPPYNVRLPQQNSEQNYYTYILDKLNLFNPKLIVVIVPETQARFSIPHPLSLLKTDFFPLHTVSGGIDIVFQAFK